MPVATFRLFSRTTHHRRNQHQHHADNRPRHAFLYVPEQYTPTTEPSTSFSVSPHQSVTMNRLALPPMSPQCLTIPAGINNKKASKPPRSAVDRWEPSLLTMTTARTITAVVRPDSEGITGRLAPSPPLPRLLSHSKSMPNLVSHAAIDSNILPSDGLVMDGDNNNNNNNEFIACNGLDPRIVMSPVPPRRRSLLNGLPAHLGNRYRRQSSPAATSIRQPPAITERFLVTSNSVLLAEFGPASTPRQLVDTVASIEKASSSTPPA